MIPFPLLDLWIAYSIHDAIACIISCVSMRERFMILVRPTSRISTWKLPAGHHDPMIAGRCSVTKVVMFALRV